MTWSEVTIPDSSPAVRLARLRSGVDGSFAVLVRFPAGWTRPISGYYLADEEFWVLEGDLTVSGVDYGVGDGGAIPAGTVRTNSSSRAGALALAFFSGSARWLRTDR